METIKLPGLNPIEIYTVQEKKPDPYERVVFIVRCPYGGTKFIEGYYRTFKTAPGRFVSEEHGSHVETNVKYWMYSYI